MKNTGVCPKCGSTDVHPALHSNSNSIRPVEPGMGAAVYTTHYVCRACGWVEEWVSQREMPLLKHHFGKA